MDLETPFVARQRWLDALESMRAHGVDWHASRFALYLAILDELLALAEQRKTDIDAYRTFREDLQRQELLFEGACQMVQLQLASKLWDQLDPKIVRTKLRKIADGPPLPSLGAQQQLATDEPRDTLVELLTAALAAESGFLPELTAVDEDLRLLLAHRPTIAIECKRPASIESLRTALSTLRRQFWTRKQMGSTLCMPVIAIERVEPFRSILVKAESAREVDEEVGRRMARAIREIRTICAQPGHGLGELSPVGLVTFSSAVLVTRPKTHVYNFTMTHPFDTGREEHSPAWLVSQLRHRAGLLSDFSDGMAGGS